MALLIGPQITEDGEEIYDFFFLFNLFLYNTSLAVSSMKENNTFRLRSHGFLLNFQNQEKCSKFKKGNVIIPMLTMVIQWTMTSYLSITGVLYQISADTVAAPE